MKLSIEINFQLIKVPIFVPNIFEKRSEISSFQIQLMYFEINIGIQLYTMRQRSIDLTNFIPSNFQVNYISNRQYQIKYRREISYNMYLQSTKFFNIYVVIYPNAVPSNQICGLYQQVSVFEQFILNKSILHFKITESPQNSAFSKNCFLSVACFSVFLFYVAQR